jgi:hypothetical protein
VSMPVASRFILCPYGQWTSVCDMKNLRNSLWVSALGADCVVGINTTAPIVPTGFGSNAPSGFWVSAKDGTGPSTFTTQRAFDGEMTAQEWLIWPVPPATPYEIAPGWLGAALIGNPATGVMTPGNALRDIAVLWTASLSTGANAITVTSAALGVLTPIHTAIVTDGAGDQCQIDTYVFVLNVGDTITSTAVATAIAQANLFYATGTGLDASGSNTTPGTSIPVTTATATARAGELVVVIGGGVGNPATYSVTGNINGALAQGFSSASPDGTLWDVECSAGTVITGGIPTSVTQVFSSAMNPAASIIVTIGLPALPGGGVTVAVIDSFDLPTDDGSTKRDISAGLPKLSRAGVAALNDLIGRLTKEDLPNERSGGIVP